MLQKRTENQQPGQDTEKLQTSSDRLGFIQRAQGRRKGQNTPKNNLHLISNQENANWN